MININNIPLVSIIIPTYGRPARLKAAIESALNQTYKNIEIVVVDDNHAESEARFMTEKVIKNFYDNRIKYIQRKLNGGGSLARNTGVEYSLGELITFLDDDDIYYTNKVAEQVECIIANKADICLCAMDIVQIDSIPVSIRNIPFGKNLREMVFNGNVFTLMIMVKKNLFLEVGGFPDCKRFQDHILMLKLLSQNPNVEIIEIPLFQYVVHDDKRISNNIFTENDILIRHQFENKYRYLLSDREIQILNDRQSKQLLSAKINEKGIYEIKNLLLGLLNNSYSISQIQFSIRYFASIKIQRNSFLRGIYRLVRVYLKR